MDIEQADTEVDEAVVPLGLHGLGQVHGRDGHVAAALHAHEHRAILGAQGRKQHALSCRTRQSDDDLLARAGVAPRGERATVAREHGDFHVRWGRLTPRIRGAKRATSMRSQHGLPAARGSSPSSARCQPSAGRAAGVVAAAAASQR